MVTQDAAMLAVGASIVTGVLTLIGSILSKRLSSPSEDQKNLNDSFRLFMEQQDTKYDDLKREHQQCTSKLGTLQGIILKLVRALREKGIALPLFSFPEQMLLLEDSNFTNEEHLNGQTPATDHAPPLE